MLVGKLTDFPLDGDELAQLKLRQRQLAWILLGVFAATSVLYGVQRRWDVIAVLVPSGLAMWIATRTNNRHPERTGLFIWSTVLASMATLILTGEGLKDVVISTLPLILVSSGQMLKPRYFAWLTLGMLALVVYLGLGHIWGYFHMGVTGTDRDRTIVLVIVLCLAALTVWTPAYDMRQTMARLKRQINQVQESENTLRFLSQHDPLTRLPNRALSAQMFEQAIAKEGRDSNRLALMFVDVDNFKNINDSLGHSAGDEFLLLVAQRLRAAVRSSDIVCRQGGDEFLIGLTGVADNASVSQVALQVLQQVSVPFELSAGQLLTTCSIGIALYPDDGDNFEDLLRVADHAMYQAKNDGRNMFHFYNAEIQSNTRRNLAMMSALRLALDSHEFELHYQPIIELESNHLIGAEALIRWRHPIQGLVPPAQFIAEAERSGLIIDIGTWVIRECCQQIRCWQDHGLVFDRISINISPVQFRRGNLEEVLTDALADADISPLRLSLEITESTLLDENDRFLNVLQHLHDMGIAISIDDFGTGYSNLRYLQRYRVETLKIDQSFVQGMCNDRRSFALMSAMVQMAHSIDMGIVAEGVETDEQRQTLIALGCTCAQGNHFAKPMSAQAFTEYALHHMHSFGDTAVEISNRPWAASQVPRSQPFSDSSLLPSLL